MTGKREKSGFTILEVVFVLIIMTIVGTMALSLFVGMDDAQRYELTRAKMEAIRRAILGTEQLDAQGRRAHFGYHGDFGAPPPSLAALTALQAPAWVYHGTLGFGTGWRGPYYQPEFTDSYGVERDFWGNPFVYSTTSLTSFGSDGLAGGSVYKQDLVLTLGTESRLSRVRGVVRDGTTPLAGRQVRLFVPSAGAIATWSALTDADGFFLFTGVPLGQRAVMVTNAPPLGPKPVVVDAPEVFLPPDTFNYFGGLQKVTVNSGGVVGCGSGDRLHHWVELNNSYLSDVNASGGFVTVWWDNGARRLNTILLNSVSQSVGMATSGTRISITKALGIPAQSTRRFELRWDGKMDLANVATEFEWANQADRDHVAWVTGTCANPAIMVTHPRDNIHSGGSSTTISLNYTVPIGALLPTLVAVASGEAGGPGAAPSSAKFGPTAMNLVTSLESGATNPRTGLGMYWLAVTAGQKGTITVTYPASSAEHTLHAYTLTSTDQKGPEAKSAAVSAGTALAAITTLSDDAVVASGGAHGNNNAMLPVGPNHIMESMRQEGSLAGAMGRVPMGPPATINSIGFTSTSHVRSIVILGSFVYAP